MPDYGYGYVSLKPHIAQIFVVVNIFFAYRVTLLFFMHYQLCPSVPSVFKNFSPIILKKTIFYLFIRHKKIPESEFRD